MSEKINRERISVAKCRSVLNHTGAGLSDEQIIVIRNYLYDLAQIDFDFFTKSQTVTSSNEDSMRVFQLDKYNNETNVLDEAA